MASQHAVIEVVCATGRSPLAFAATPLGRSLTTHSGDTRLVAHIVYHNAFGLPEIYNQRILHTHADVVVFIHDDVWIDDPEPADALLRGLSAFDIVGVAGNRRLPPHHVGWAFIDERFTWDSARHLSGAVAHGPLPCGAVSRYGETPAECQLLDGVLLAARPDVLRRRSTLFDPAFDFHFYDLDFCRTAATHGLRLGTWPIAITHVSGGSFGSPLWRSNHRRYRQKWMTTRRPARVRARG